MPTLLPPWHKRTKLLPSLVFIMLNQQVTGSLLESLIAKRTEYWENCNRTLTTDALTKTGNFCKGTFDTFACWPHSSPGNVSVPCPPYLPWVSEDNTRRVHRECLENGRWRRMGNSSEPWRDDSECQEDHYFKDKEDEMFRQTALRLISVIGYSLSLFSLTLATLLMGMLRSVTRRKELPDAHVDKAYISTYMSGLGRLSFIPLVII